MGLLEVSEKTISRPVGPGGASGLVLQALNEGWRYGLGQKCVAVGVDVAPRVGIQSFRVIPEAAVEVEELHTIFCEHFSEFLEHRQEFLSEYGMGLIGGETELLFVGGEGFVRRQVLGGLQAVQISNVAGFAEIVHLD